MPRAPSSSPPHQHSAATTPALRGPALSSQPPQIAAAMPSSTKNKVYIQPMLATRQSQLVVSNSCTSVISRQPLVCVTPSERESGNQKTEKPYAMPMQRWMHRAAGGTSQRLKPGLATMRSRSRIPTLLTGISAVVPIAAIASSPRGAPPQFSTQPTEHLAAIDARPTEIRSIRIFRHAIGISYRLPQQGLGVGHSANHALGYSVER